MKNLLQIFCILCLSSVLASAQMGPMPGRGQFGGGLEKLYGSNQTFSATMDMEVHHADNDSPMTVSGKISFNKGDSRFEMDMTAMQGANMPPQAVAQMKSMGLDRMLTISKSHKKIVYLIYPNAQSYVEIIPPTPTTTDTNVDSPVQMTELGKETVDGHPCVKNKAVFTDNKGQKHEFTVWNATDLKNFPVKIQMNEQGNAITISYRDISFSEPDTSLFTTPAGYTKYDSMQEMMQQVMMKKMGGGMGMPPQQ